MTKSFKCTITTPEGLVFSQDVERVTLGTEMGEVTILANHEPLVGLAKGGEVVIERAGEVQKLNLGSGVLEVEKSGNLTLLLTK